MNELMSKVNGYECFVYICGFVFLFPSLHLYSLLDRSYDLERSSLKRSRSMKSGKQMSPRSKKYLKKYLTWEQQRFNICAAAESGRGPAEVAGPGQREKVQASEVARRRQAAVCQRNHYIYSPMVPRPKVMRLLLYEDVIFKKCDSSDRCGTSFGSSIGRGWDENTRRTRPISLSVTIPPNKTYERSQAAGPFIALGLMVQHTVESIYPQPAL